MPLMHWSAALLAITGVAGCSAREAASSASGDYDMGVACMSAGGECYTGTVRSLCLQTGPAGCDEDPTAVNALFCCLQFSDASLYSTAPQDAAAESGQDN